MGDSCYRGKDGFDEQASSMSNLTLTIGVAE